MIPFTCVHCRQTLQARVELAGKQVQCSRCRKALLVPVPAAPPPTEAFQRNLSLQRAIQSSRQSTDADDAAGTIGGEYDFLAPPQASGELGRLGEYRILRVLGKGGMGVVFEAEDGALGRRVALKTMKAEVAGSAAARERFVREARAVAGIQHENVVTVFRVGQEGTVAFLAMEFLRGESLEDRIGRVGRLPVADVLRIGREVAAGLAAAHAIGLVHRDVKPANIWLEGDRARAKLLDFGLVRAAHEEPGLTQSGVIVGTPAYMAPEQAKGREVDARSDLFSLGCVLYRLTTGQPPFRGADSISTLVAVSTEHPKPPAVLRPDAPPALSDLIVRLLAKDPQQRPASAQATADALAQIEADPTAALKSAGRAGSRFPGRGVVLAAGLGGAVLLLFAFVVGLWWVFAGDGRGRVAIALEDPSAPVRVEVDGMVLPPSELDKPLRLTPGSHRLRVSGDGFELFERDFVVRPGDNPAIAARVRRSAAPPRTDPADKQKEKEVARVMEAGDRAIQLNNYAEAVKQYTHAAELKPEPFEVYRQRGLAYVGLGRFDEAIADYDRALAKRSDVSILYYYRGLAYFQRAIYKGRPEDARKGIDDFTRALEREPREANYYFVRARARHFLRQLRPSLEDFDQAVRYGARPEIYWDRALVHVDLGELDKAVEDCDAILKIEQMYAPAYRFRGQIRTRQGDFESAERDLNTSLRLAPREPETLASRGNLYLAKKEPRLALADIEAAIALAPRFANYYLMRAQAHDDLNEKEAAEADRKKARELGAR